MKIVVVGKGGREHALAQKLKSSPLVTNIWVLPGNPGMALAGLNCVSCETPQDIENFCFENGVSLAVVGPEAAILSDLKTRLEARNIFCFAPSPAVAQLEASKLFCKTVLSEAGLPTAQYIVAQSATESKKIIDKHNFSNPLVVKADGLAQGKGVWVCNNYNKAIEAADYLGVQYGYPLLFEECLVGRELSAFAICDGKDFVILGTACDYKRIAPDPFSSNTGGMGAYSPCDFIDFNDEATIRETFRKTLDHLHAKNLSYQGFLFAGLMKTSNGLYVLEYNVRMGDPETQVLMPRLQSDLAEIIMKACNHQLRNSECKVSSDSAVHIVAVSKGYPQTEMLLEQTVNFPPLKSLQGHLYFSGVSKKDNQLVNSGGRVLGITATAETKQEARRLAYHEIRRISFEGMYIREDIGS